MIRWADHNGRGPLDICVRFYGLGGANGNAEVKRAGSRDLPRQKREYKAIPHIQLYRSFLDGGNERNLRGFTLKLPLT